MADGSMLLATLLALSSGAGDAGLPNLTQVQAALNALENCRGFTLADCPSSQRVYRVHGVRCLGIAPEEAQPAVACRVDLTLDYPNREQNTRHRDECIRFARRGETGGALEWTSLQIRDRPCEIGSMLTRDPHPEPDRAELESALLFMYTCFDFDGLTDCFTQPTGAQIRSAVCEPIAPNEDGHALALCRLTARISFGRSGRPVRLDDACVQLERFSPPEEDPPGWGAMEIVDAMRCERR